MERFNRVESIDFTMNLSGMLLAIKGFGEKYHLTATIDTKRQYTVLRNLGTKPDEKLVYTPNRVWIERDDGTMVDQRENPRDAFKGHGRATRWDSLHLAYFAGYAFWNYLVAPFCFTWPGFSTRELRTHTEDGEEWRVLEVTYPEEIVTHSKTQRFYWNDKFRLQRIDYTVELVAGSAAHYVFDHAEVGGLVYPMMRRVVPRDPGTGVCSIHGPTTFGLDYCGLVLHLEDGSEVVNRGAYAALAETQKG